MPPRDPHLVLAGSDAIPEGGNVFDLVFLRQRVESFGDVWKWLCGHPSSVASVSKIPSIC